MLGVFGVCVRYLLDYQLLKRGYGTTNAKWRERNISYQQKKWLHQRKIKIQPDWNRGIVSDLMGSYIQSYSKKK